MDYAAVLAVAAVLGVQLSIPPRVGLANNGDFSKIVGIFSLGAPSEDEYAYADLKYHFDPRYRWRAGYYSSETLLAAAGIGLNSLLSKQGVFDLRWMGFLHGLLLVISVYLLQPLLADLSKLRRAALSIAVVFIFGDFMYSSYLNSFYMDAATYVFLMLAVVLFLRAARWRRRPEAIGLVVCVALMILSKPQHAVLGVWVAALFACSGASLWPRNGRPFALASAAIVFAATLLGLKAAPPEYAAHGYYSVIFYQVLPHSRDVRRDLYGLGLDASYQKWIATHAYSTGSGMNDPAFVRSFLGRTSYARLGWYFLAHPRNAYLALDASLAEAGRQRPAMGNFDGGAGLPAYSESHVFTLWSDAKRKLFYRHGARYLVCYVLAATLVCSVATARRRTLPGVLVAGVYALSAMGMTAMLVASLGDAVEVTRHHFISSTIFDLQLLLAFVLLISRPSTITPPAGTP